jgi:hypothetical protein
VPIPAELSQVRVRLTDSSVYLAVVICVALVFTRPLGFFSVGLRFNQKETSLTANLASADYVPVRGIGVAADLEPPVSDDITLIRCEEVRVFAEFRFVEMQETSRAPNASLYEI